MCVLWGVHSLIGISGRQTQPLVELNNEVRSLSTYQLVYYKTTQKLVCQVCVAQLCSASSLKPTREKQQFLPPLTQDTGVPKEKQTLPSENYAILCHTTDEGRPLRMNQLPAVAF